jgi:DNA-binding CsgD family transcriptional regulator
MASSSGGGLTARAPSDADTDHDRPRPMLLGREQELRSLVAVLDAVDSGSASLVIHGEAGQGKSSLLRWAARSASDRGFTVLWATGIEFERELGFSGLTAVLRPLHDRVDGLGDAQRDSLNVAMGLVVGEAPVLTTYGATLALLSLAADEAPLLVVVDDAQWVDQASLESLVFAAHRAGADHVGFAFAHRTGVPCLLDRTGFDRIELRGLAEAAAVKVLTSHGVAPDVARRCWERTGGNPLALIEGARGLTAGQRAGDEPLPPALPAAGRSLDAFRSRLDELPDATVQALGLAALEASNDLALVAPALSTAGSSVAELAPAERRGLVAIAGSALTWRHPLLRSAVYQHVDSHWRRQAHRALADAALAAGHGEKALWHLSETIVEPDDEVAGRLAALGVAARRRGALISAAEAHEQAARWSTVVAAGDCQNLAAADARWAGGDLNGAAKFLSARISHVGAVETRAQMAMVLGQAEMWTVGSAAGIERFELHTSAVSDTHPDIGALLLLHAATARMLALDSAAAVATAERAVALAERTDDNAVLFAASAMLTLAQIFAGGGPAFTERLGPITQMSLAALGAGTEGADDLAQLCAYGLVACERWPEATDLLRLIISSGERSGMVGRTAFARLLLAEVLWRTGRWAESLAELTQAVSLQEAVSPGHVVPGTVAVLARIEAALGQSDSCREHVKRVLESPPRIEMFSAIALSAVGLLELGSGHNAEAAEAFDQIVARADQVAEPGWLWWQGDAIEAYAGCGRTAEARRALLRLEGQAAATGRGWALATVARARGVLAEGEDSIALLKAALEAFRAVGAPFEEARTLMVLGSRRISQDDRVEGARDVAAARTAFDRLGARDWSQRASTICGEASGAEGSLTSRLTPAELRVAMVVGRGASNRDAADQLFISPKTVDYHLQSIYRKLGMRSRTQLMTLVLTQAGPFR